MFCINICILSMDYSCLLCFLAQGHSLSILKRWSLNNEDKNKVCPIGHSCLVVLTMRRRGRSSGTQRGMAAIALYAHGIVIMNAYSGS